MRRISALVHRIMVSQAAPVLIHDIMMSGCLACGPRHRDIPMSDHRPYFQSKSGQLCKQEEVRPACHTTDDTAP